MNSNKHPAQFATLITPYACWPYSTFHRYVARDIYPATWGDGDRLTSDGEYGE